MRVPITTYSTLHNTVDSLTLEEDRHKAIRFLVQTQLVSWVHPSRIPIIFAKSTKWMCLCKVVLFLCFFVFLFYASRYIKIYNISNRLCFDQFLHVCLGSNRVIMREWCIYAVHYDYELIYFSKSYFQILSKFSYYWVL